MAVATIKETAVSEPLTMALMRKKLGDDEVRIRVALLRALMSAGDSDTAILEKTNWDPKALEILRKELYRAELIHVDKPTEHIYVDYLIRQQDCIFDLNRLITRLMSATETIEVEDNGKREKIQIPAVKHATAVVGAIKAKADIHDRVLDRGQDLGLLHKAPERKEIIAGIAIAQVSTHDLRGEVASEIGKFQKLVQRYGDAVLADAEVIEPVPRPTRIQGQAARVKRIVGRGADRARAGRQRARGEIRIKRQKAMVSPPTP